jgi:diadenylate cyclase
LDGFIENLKARFTGTQNIIVSVLDMALFAALLFAVFKLLKKNNAVKLIFIIVPVLLISAVLTSEALGFVIMGKVFSYTVLFAILIAFILVPQEIRRGLWKVSSSKEARNSFSTAYVESDEELKEAVDNIVRAVQNMAKKNIGALIIVAPTLLPAHILESGTPIDGRVTSLLIETVFHDKTPLHDGAMCIHGNRVVAAGCFLPLSQNNALDKTLGTRHRAAIGVTENYSVFSIIVSEETGVISTAKDGQINRYYDSVMLTDILMRVYGLKASVEPAGKAKRIRKK